MNEWIIWPVGITAWLLVGFALFWVFELPPLLHGDTAGRTTLSNWVWVVFEKFPVSIIYFTLNLGIVLGGLMVHFFWHWCPLGAATFG